MEGTKKMDLETLNSNNAFADIGLPFKGLLDTCGQIVEYKETHNYVEFGETLSVEKVKKSFTTFKGIFNHDKTTMKKIKEIILDPFYDLYSGFLLKDILFDAEDSSDIKLTFVSVTDKSKTCPLYLGKIAEWAISFDKIETDAFYLAKLKYYLYLSLSKIKLAGIRESLEAIAKIHGMKSGVVKVESHGGLGIFGDVVDMASKAFGLGDMNLNDALDGQSPDGIKKLFENMRNNPILVSKGTEIFSKILNNNSPNGFSDAFTELGQAMNDPIVTDNLKEAFDNSNFQMVSRTSPN